MKSGVKGFWKKQKYVIHRHKPSSFPPRITVTYANDINLDYLHKGYFDLDHLRKSCSVEVKFND